MLALSGARGDLAASFWSLAEPSATLPGSRRAGVERPHPLRNHRPATHFPALTGSSRMADRPNEHPCSGPPLRFGLPVRQG